MSSERLMYVKFTPCVQGDKVTIQITEQLLRQRRVQNTVKLLRWSVLQKKKIMPDCMHETGNFSGQGRIRGIGAL